MYSISTAFSLLPVLVLKNVPCIDCGIIQIRQDKEIQSFHVLHKYILTFMVFNSTTGENHFGAVGSPLFQSNPLCRQIHVDFGQSLCIIFAFFTSSKVNYFFICDIFSCFQCPNRATEECVSTSCSLRIIRR